MRYDTYIVEKFNKRKEMEVAIRERVDYILDKYSDHINYSLNKASITQDHVSIYRDDLKKELIDVLNNKENGFSTNVEKIVLDELEINFIFVHSFLRGGVEHDVLEIQGMYVDIEKLLSHYNNSKTESSCNLSK